MANTGFAGLDVRQIGDRILFDAFLLDTAGAIVSTGTTNLRLYELQDDGTLKSYDWNDNTFKTGALTTENQSMTHRQGNNSTTNTGLWTRALTTVTGFTAGAIYLAQVNNSSASPAWQTRKFQYGRHDGMQRKVAFPNFEFVMYDESDPKSVITGLSFAAGTYEVSLDGNAYDDLTNAPTELSDGTYVIDLTAADLDGRVVTLKFTPAGAVARLITLLL